MGKKLKAASVSITVNLALLASKIFAAIVTGSIALFAECAHSLFDLVASLLAFMGIRQAEKPSDEEHQYGHEKFETLSSFLQALLILATAIFVIFEATEKLIYPSPIESSEVGIILMIISIPVTLLTSRYLSKIAVQEGGSHALEADSAHFTTDVLSSVSVLLGLLAVRLGYAIGDVVAAYFVGVIMAYIAVILIIEAYKVFMDHSPDAFTMHEIISSLDSINCITYHKLMARRAGSKIFVNVHVQVHKDMTVHQAHTLGGKIKKQLITKVPQIKEVTMHIEPK